MHIIANCINNVRIRSTNKVRWTLAMKTRHISVIIFLIAMKKINVILKYYKNAAK